MGSNVVPASDSFNWRVNRRGEGNLIFHVNLIKFISGMDGRGGGGGEEENDKIVQSTEWQIPQHLTGGQYHCIEVYSTMVLLLMMMMMTEKPDHYMSMFLCIVMESESIFFSAHFLISHPINREGGGTCKSSVPFSPFQSRPSVSQGGW